MIAFTRWGLLFLLVAGTFLVGQEPSKPEPNPAIKKDENNKKDDVPPPKNKEDLTGKGDPMPPGENKVGPGRGIKPPAQVVGPDGKPVTGSTGLTGMMGSNYQPPTEVGGKLLRDWVIDLRSADPSLREQAIRAIASFGPNAREAIPQLVERMADRDSSPRMRAVLAIKYMDYYDKDIPKVVDGLAKRVSEDPQAAIRYEALMALGRFNYQEGGRTALPAVLKVADDQGNWEVRRSAYSILPKLGADETGVDARVYKALINGVKDTAARARHEALIGLALLGKPNDAVLATQMEKALISVLNSRDVPSEIFARVALIGYNSANTKIQMPLIIKHVRDTDFAHRMIAIRAVSMLGPPAHESVPDLVIYLNDKNPELIMSVCMALTSMGPDAQRAADPLRQFLSKKEIPDDLRSAASFALDAVSRRRFNVTNPNLPR